MNWYKAQNYNFVEDDLGENLNNLVFIANFLDIPKA